jgi:hypothetical protein
LRLGGQQADEVAAEAQAAIDRLMAAPLEAEIEKAHGPAALLSAHQFATGAWSAANDGMPVDAQSGELVGAEKPAAGTAQVVNRSWRTGTRSHGVDPAESWDGLQTR